VLEEGQVHPGLLGLSSDLLLPVLAGICFVAMVLGGVLITPHNALRSRGGAKLPMPVLGNRPILQVELARDDEDLRSVLLAGDVKQNLQDAKIGNRLDNFLFVPAYSGFLLALGLLLASSDNRFARLAFLLAVLVVPVIAVCDWLENLGITRTIGHIESNGAPESGDAVRISFPSIIKWCLIAGVLIGYALVSLSNVSLPYGILGLLLLAIGAIVAITMARYLRLRFWARY